MVRTDIINYLIQKYNFKTYLEIGVYDNYNFDQVKCKYRIGVDPIGDASFSGTSDEFFEQNNLQFDLVFVDGLHIEEQITRDITNALRVIPKHGIVVVHDCLPENEEQQCNWIREDGAWTGPVWKSLAKLKMKRGDIELKIVDTDWGCGIIRLKDTDVYRKNDSEMLDYNYFVNHKHEMFDIISPTEFLNIYNGQ